MKVGKEKLPTYLPSPYLNQVFHSWENQIHSSLVDEDENNDNNNNDNNNNDNNINDNNNIKSSIN